MRFKENFEQTTQSDFSSQRTRSKENFTYRTFDRKLSTYRIWCNQNFDRSTRFKTAFLNRKNQKKTSNLTIYYLFNSNIIYLIITPISWGLPNKTPNKTLKKSQRTRVHTKHTKGNFEWVDSRGIHRVIDRFSSSITARTHVRAFTIDGWIDRW